MNRWIWPVLLVATIFLASSSNPAGPRGLAHLDKLIHFLFFGLMAVLMLRCRTPVTWSWALMTLMMISGYGILDEFRQSFTPGRSVEWQDWLADTLGGLVSIVLYKTVPFYARFLEFEFGSKTRQADLSTNNSGNER